jgi:hypothetical protein
MKYRKRPVVIEAVTWQGKYTSPGEWPEWFNDAIRAGTISTRPSGALMIDTREGVMRADIGDMVIRGVKGELYPCKPDIFEATYKPAGEAQSA